MSYRKVERIEVRLPGVKPDWKEISFFELKKDDIFKLTDLDDNGKVSIDGEDGKNIYVATGDPYSKDEVLTIEAENYEGIKEDLFIFNP